MEKNYKDFFKEKNIDLLEDIFFQEIEGAAFFIESKDFSWQTKFNFLYNNLQKFHFNDIVNFESFLLYFNRESEICETEGADRCYNSLKEQINSTAETSVIHIPVSKNGTSYVFRLKILRFVEKGLIFGILTILDNVEVNYEKLIASSYKDSLTGLFNRNTFNLHIAMAENGKHYIGFMDLDNFKFVNDTYSHERGDELLKDIGGIMIYLIADEHVIFYRFGGDEFLFFTNGYTKQQTMDMIEKLRKAITKLKIKDYVPTFSIGYLEVDFDKNDIPKTQLVNLADVAMYEAKINGKDQITYLTESEIQEELKTNSVESKLSSLRSKCERSAASEGLK